MCKTEQNENADIFYFRYDSKAQMPEFSKVKCDSVLAEFWPQMTLIENDPGQRATTFFDRDQNTQDFPVQSATSTGGDTVAIKTSTTFLNVIKDVKISSASTSTTAAEDEYKDKVAAQ